MTKIVSRYGAADPTVPARAFYLFVRSLIWAAGKLLFRIEVHGREHIPASGAFVLAPGAHRSNLETFVVSLALALGLADVIAHEVGGADLDTLFVDEGFGSLDAETLEGVMDTLDSLRDGGRVVGVVSHVAEMRDRIPVQLRVTKSRQGSSLSLSR